MIGQPYKGHIGSIHLVTYSPDGARIASGAADHIVRVWDPLTSKLLHTLNGHWRPVESVAFLPDGKYVISGSMDGYVQKWGLSTFSKSVKYECVGPVNFVDFSPDGSDVVAGFGSTVRILNPQIKTLRTVLSLPKGENVHWVGFSLEGNSIISVSTSNEGTRRLPNETNQQPPQRPNFIRIWRTSSSLNRTNLSSTPGCWLLEPDGRILSPEGFVAWVPLDISRYLGRESTSGTYYNPFVLLPGGMIDIEREDLCVGKRWTECYPHKG